MWEILIFILTGFVLYHTMRLVKWIHQVNRTRKEMHQTLENLFSQMGSARQQQGVDGFASTNADDFAHKDDFAHPGQQNRKLFTASDGEYTEFEEIPDQESKPAL